MCSGGRAGWEDQRRRQQLEAAVEGSGKMPSLSEQRSGKKVTPERTAASVSTQGTLRSLLRNEVETSDNQISRANLYFSSSLSFSLVHLRVSSNPPLPRRFDLDDQVLIFFLSLLSADCSPLSPPPHILLPSPITVVSCPSTKLPFHPPWPRHKKRLMP